MDDLSMFAADFSGGFLLSLWNRIQFPSKIPKWGEIRLSNSVTHVGSSHVNYTLWQAVTFVNAICSACLINFNVPQPHRNPLRLCGSRRLATSAPSFKATEKGMKVCLPPVNNAVWQVEYACRKRITGFIKAYLSKRVFFSFMTLKRKKRKMASKQIWQQILTVEKQLTFTDHYQHNEI